jgi:hypothetical protein
MKNHGGEILGACSEPGAKFSLRTKEFIEVFLAPRHVLGLAPAVNAVLGGNVGNSFPIRW